MGVCACSAVGFAPKDPSPCRHSKRPVFFYESIWAESERQLQTRGFWLLPRIPEHIRPYAPLSASVNLGCNTTSNPEEGARKRSEAGQSAIDLYRSNMRGPHGRTNFNRNWSVSVLLILTTFSIPSRRSFPPPSAQQNRDIWFASCLNHRNLRDVTDQRAAATERTPRQQHGYSDVRLSTRENKKRPCAVLIPI